LLNKNLLFVKERLERAASKRGASANDIALVAVSKTVPVEIINEAWKLGITSFGENRVQDAVSKIGSLPEEINWHFIGHLQTNKVKQVLPLFKLIHSLDSIRLARVIQKEGENNSLSVNVLLQVNIALEESKYGFQEEEVKDALEEISSYKNLRVLGLMGIAPFTPDPEEIRPYFRQLHRIFEEISIPGVEMKYLSMGMSNDFEIAVEEGANMVRLGSVLFGERT
jgi:PLP dependent protein